VWPYPRLHVTQLILHTEGSDWADLTYRFTAGAYQQSAFLGGPSTTEDLEPWSLNTPRVLSSLVLAALAFLRRITSFREVTRTSPFSTDRRSYQPPMRQVLISTRVSDAPSFPPSTHCDKKKVVRTSYSDIFYTRLARDAIQEWKKSDEWGDCYRE